MSSPFSLTLTSDFTCFDSFVTVTFPFVVKHVPMHSALSQFSSMSSTERPKETTWYQAWTLMEEYKKSSAGCSKSSASLPKFSARRILTMFSRAQLTAFAALAVLAAFSSGNLLTR